MKAEEERKIATLTRSDVGSLSVLDDHSDDEYSEHVPQRYVDCFLFKIKIYFLFISSRPASIVGIVRTAKAEKRLKDQLREEGLLTDEDEMQLSPAEERALRAQKRAAWRQARLKSLEQDAIQAQMVLKSMTDMVSANEASSPVQEEKEVK